MYKIADKIGCFVNGSVKRIFLAKFFAPCIIGILYPVAAGIG